MERDLLTPPAEARTGTDVYLPGGRDVAPRRARRTARLQRHDGHLLLGAGRLPPRGSRLGLVTGWTEKAAHEQTFVVRAPRACSSVDRCRACRLPAARTAPPDAAAAAPRAEADRTASRRASCISTRRSSQQITHRGALGRAGRRRDQRHGHRRVQRRSHGPHPAAGLRPGPGAGPTSATTCVRATCCSSSAAARSPPPSPSTSAAQQGPRSRGEDLRDDAGSLRAPGRIADRAATVGERARQGARQGRARAKRSLRVLGLRPARRGSDSGAVPSRMAVRAPIGGTVTERDDDRRPVRRRGQHRR